MLVRDITEEKAKPNWYDTKKNWEADLGSVLKWLSVMRQSNSEYTLPNLNDSLIFVGLVGDPKFRDKSYLALADEAFSILNQYEPGEKIDVNTRTRLISKYDTIPGAYGQFIPDMGNSFNSWQIHLRKTADTLINRTGTLADRLQNSNTLVHEAMHRGFEIWRTLIRNGLIKASQETAWCINASKRPGPQINGEHAVIFNKLQKRNRGRWENFVEPWAAANRSYLIRNFDLYGPKFNDRYVDLTNDREITQSKQQLSLWLDIVYNKASDEVGEYLGKKFLESPRPRARPGTGSQPSDGTSTTSEPLKNKEQFQETLINALLWLQSDKKRFGTEQKKQHLTRLLIQISGAKQAKHLEIINSMLDEMWRNTDGLTAEMMPVGVNLLYDPKWLK